jgi:[ribosomal protein S18]-alanine N-acetyltransferase
MYAPGEKIGDSSAVTVRRMSTSDASAAHSILKESPEASIWSREVLVESASGGVAWSAELDGRVAGILIGRVAADEFEILNLAVGKSCRRRGVATQLVGAALEYARSAGARQSYLEVRASNEGGIAFYMRLGFRLCGRRPNYYREPEEEAVLLVLHKDGTNPYF